MKRRMHCERISKSHPNKVTSFLLKHALGGQAMRLCIPSFTPSSDQEKIIDLIASCLFHQNSTANHSQILIAKGIDAGILTVRYISRIFCLFAFTVGQRLFIKNL